VREPPTAGLAILWCRASGDWLSLGAEPVFWRRYPNHGPSSERRRYLVLGSECEIVLRTCIGPGCFTRPTGDLDLQLCRRTDHVETWSPPYVTCREIVARRRVRAQQPELFTLPFGIVVLQNEAPVRLAPWRSAPMSVEL
jgi:hypothetical protein